MAVQVPPDLIVEERRSRHKLYVDHHAGRLFLYMFGPTTYSPGCLVPGVNPATLAYSGDNGNTWT
jgi:hypothetical protein